jgi:fructose transport system substrate-binding protein
MRQPVVFFAALGIALGVTAANAADKPVVGLITKTNTNPFFVKMKGAQKRRRPPWGIELRARQQGRRRQ